MVRIRIGLVLVLAAGAMAHFAVAQKDKPASTPLAVVSTVPADLAAASIVREIDDPGSGVRWLLVEDPEHPCGPGRMIALAPGEEMHGVSTHGANSARTAAVIHAGDRVQVVEHTAVMDASMEAVALASAAPGGPLRVRLRVGGRVLSARALGPGLAVLAPVGEKP